MGRSNHYLLAATKPRLVTTPAIFEAGVSDMRPSQTAFARGVDEPNNVIHFADYTGGLARATDDFGATWSTFALPSGVTYNSFGPTYRWNDKIYLVGNDGAGERVFRTDPFLPGATPTWEDTGFTLASGAARINSMLVGDDTYLYIAEYGAPSGGPQCYRSSNGTSWTSVLGPEATNDHFHAVAADPYRPGHVYITAGDGTSKTHYRSTDYGDSWTVIETSSNWQAVEISFSPQWVWFAGDNRRGTVFVMDRQTLTFRHAARNWHAYTQPPGASASTDLYYKNAYTGIVDPDTGIFYACPMDTSAGGNTRGLFYLPEVGGRLELLDDTVGHNDMFLLGDYLIVGDFRVERLAFG